MKAYFEIKEENQNTCCFWQSTLKKQTYNPYKVQAVEIFKKSKTEPFESPYKIALCLGNQEDFSTLRGKILIAIRMGMEAHPDYQGYDMDESEAKNHKIIVEGNIEQSLNLFNHYNIIPKSTLSLIRKDNFVLKFISSQQKDKSSSSEPETTNPFNAFLK